MTSSLSLDGPWDFLYVADDRQMEPATVRSIDVPGPWQAQFADLRMRAGTAIYARDFDVPVGFKNGRIFVRFGAVFHHTRAWLNDIPIGEHQGGFLPFAFDITEYVVEGRNQLKLRVESPTDNPTLYPDAPLGEIPFGKQSWYGPLSGIWQGVRIERRHRDHVARMRILPDLATGKVRATIFFHAPIEVATSLTVSVTGPDGQAGAAATEKLAPGDEEVSLTVQVADVRAWSPEKPNLYQLGVALEQAGTAIDAKAEAFGFRTVETRNGRIWLNGEPIFLRAALDQDYYPDSICTVPSVAFLEDQFRKAKELGLNCLRCHIKAADPRYYEVADRIGLLIWTELPNGGVSTERSRVRKERLLKGIVDRDGNHPSIIIWTIINENWGVDLVHDADHRAWLKRTFHWLKGYDPTRLVVDNSPLAPSFHVETDIADYHFYAAYPDNRRAWDAFVDELSSRASWLFSPEGDAVIKGDEPLMCSEFGNWGLPHPDDLRDADGKEPWWFETGHDWGEGVMYAHGIENRFVDWSLDRVFGDLRGFVEAAQWQQYRALKYEIEVMRRRPALAGYVITEFTDAHWECNGLLDMRRNVRVFHHDFAAINADLIIIPRWERLTYWDGEPLRVDLTVSNGAGPLLEGCAVEAVIGGSTVSRYPVQTLPSGIVADLGFIDIPLPVPKRSRRYRVEFLVRDGTDAVLARNHLDVSVHRRPSPEAFRIIAVWSGDEAMRERLATLGYTLAEDASKAEVIVAHDIDKALLALVRDGARLLLLPGSEVSLNPLFPHWQNVRVVARAGTLWAGDWASTFAWLVRGRSFEDIPGGPLIDEPFDRVIPTHVIAGCNLHDFQSRVLAGMVIGWVHKPVALAVERTYGRGHFVVSTFRLTRDPAGEDPTATLILKNLIEQAAARGHTQPRPADEEEAA
jgi:hypothetical protein